MDWLFVFAPVRKGFCDDLEELCRSVVGFGDPNDSNWADKKSCCDMEPIQEEQIQRVGLVEFTEGVYICIASYLDAPTLGRVDATCRLLREVNCCHGGPWYELGLRTHYGLELDGDGLFELDRSRGGSPKGGGISAHVDWKGRYYHFYAEVPTFRGPFGGAEITTVHDADEIAYCSCRFRTDLLIDPLPSARTTGAVYLEVEVFANPDNVSLAVVDFEAGGCSSVTFSPDTGAVICERKVCETPRKVEGAYIQPLTITTPGCGFLGLMGLYLHKGHLAFFRRQATSAGEGDELEVGPWECTGFVTDLSWAEGRQLTPCLAFRNEGMYRVRMACVGSYPPTTPEWNTMAYEKKNWSSLDWDAGQEDTPDWRYE